MNFLKKNKNWEENNWEFVEISKINDDIVKKLINNLKLDLSDDFYISFESLLKIGRKAGETLESAITELEENNNFQKELFKILLDNAHNKEIYKPLIVQLYHPDFVIRAQTILQLEKSGDVSYLRYILPLADDPDASVRWAALNWFINTNQISDSTVLKKLNSRAKRESNAVIKAKLDEIVNSV